jgi:crotonobetainyl-CoA:carnitine CoA-transferase CaiB-like acyl-CoA transferase
LLQLRRSLDVGAVTVLRSPSRFSAPEHGHHTEEVMLELGYTWEEIGALRDSGAV